jgi:hypothetical protein
MTSSKRSGLDSAVDEADAPVGGLGHFFAVGDKDHGGLFSAGEGGQEVDHGSAGGGVEIAGGFVGQKNGGAVDEGTGEGGSLELAAGELVGSMAGAVGQTHGVKEGPGPGFACRISPTGEEEGEKDIFLHREGGEEVEKLEDKADLELAEGGELVVVEGVKGMALEIDLAGGGSVEGAENVEEGAFAATAGPSDGNDLAREDLQADGAEGIHFGIAGLVGFMEIACFEHKKAGLRDK